MGRGVRAFLRHLFLALNIAGLVMAATIAGGATTAAASAMPGRCAHCGAGDPARGKTPLCGVPACAAAAIEVATPAAAAPLSLSRAAYRAGRAQPLAGEAPKTDPPPPRSPLAR